VSADDMPFVINDDFLLVVKTKPASSKLQTQRIPVYAFEKTGPQDLMDANNRFDNSPRQAMVP
jgi:hypothetical protein